MTRYTAFACAVVLTLLTACSNQDQTEASVNGAFVAGLKDVFDRQTAEPAPKPVVTRALFAGATEPLWLITLVDVDAIASVSRIQTNGDAETYQAADGLTITFKNGIVIATRGYSADLMQADVSGLQAALRRGQGTYAKRMSYVNGQDRLETLTFRCELTSQGADAIEILGKRHQTRRMQETCRENGRQIDNTYWVEGNRMVKSRQWISDGISRLMLERI